MPGRGPLQGRAARGGLPEPGPGTEGSYSMPAAPWSGSWGWTLTSQPSMWWRGGRAGRLGAGREGVSSSSMAFAVTSPVAADACGDQRCEMEWTDGQTVGMLSLCCLEPPPRREGAAACFLRDLRDVHKGEALCGLCRLGSLRPRWAQGQLCLLSPAAGRKLAGSLPLWVPRPKVCCVGTGARRLSRLSLRGFPGEVLACASVVVSP